MLSCWLLGKCDRNTGQHDWNYESLCTISRVLWLLVISKTAMSHSASRHDFNSVDESGDTPRVKDRIRCWRDSDEDRSRRTQVAIGERRGRPRELAGSRSVSIYLSDFRGNSALPTEKTFKRVTIWPHRQASIQNIDQLYPVGMVLIVDKMTLIPCRSGIDCVCSEALCTDQFPERR